MLQKGILFSHSHSLCMCVWDCMEGCRSSHGFQCPTLWRSTAFTPLSLTEPRVWYFSGTGWPVSSQDLPVSMPELQLSLHVGAVSSTHVLTLTEQALSPTLPSPNSVTALRQNCDVLRAAEATQTLAVSVPIHEWIFQALCSTPIAEKWTHVCQA